MKVSKDHVPREESHMKKQLGICKRMKPGKHVSREYIPFGFSLTGLLLSLHSFHCSLPMLFSMELAFSTFILSKRFVLILILRELCKNLVLEIIGGAGELSPLHRSPI